MSAAGHRRLVGLDVVRAAAIGMVLASHGIAFAAAWFGFAAPFAVSVAGFFGVELFFVLSGFLIGGLLIEAAAGVRDGRGAWAAWWLFMRRRWLRTLPAYYACIATLALLGGTGLSAPVTHVAAHLTLTQNLAWPMLGGWFAVSWSLGVEEWFYLLFATLVLGGTLLAGRRGALLLAVALFLMVPPALRAMLPAGVNWDEFTSKVVPFRLDAIGYGVVAAWLMHGRRVGWAWRLLALAAGVALIWAIWTGRLSGIVPQPVFLADCIFPLCSLGFALCMPAASAWVSAPRLVAWPARLVSRHAYTLYLVHLTVLSLVAGWALGAWASLAAAVLLTALAAGLLTRFVEQPGMRWRPAGRATVAALPASPRRRTRPT